MDAQTCLKKLEYVGVLAFATVDKNGAPQIRNISAIHYEADRMIFFTAKEKALPYSAKPLLTLRKLFCGLPCKGDRKA